MTRLSRCAGLLLHTVLLASSLNVLAQKTPDKDKQNHERTYQVELIVFSRVDENSEEHWPQEIKLAYPEDVLLMQADTSAAGGLSLAPANERLLNQQAAAIAKNPGYRLLYHQAWRQMINAQKSHIAISGGKIFNGHHELEGYISLSVGQYLKLQTNLWLSQFVPLGSATTDTWPDLPLSPDREASATEAPQDYAIARTLMHTQERSMRSQEVHYLDHPLMGVIVKITPYGTAN